MALLVDSTYAPTRGSSDETPSAFLGASTSESDARISRATSDCLTHFSAELDACGYDVNRVDDRTAELKQVNRGRIRDARIRDKTKLSRPLNLIFGEFKHLMEDPYETRDIVSEARQAAHSIDAENGGEEARKGLFYQIGTSVVLTAIDGKHPLKTAGGEEIVYLVLKDKRQILLSKSYVDRVGYDEAIGKLEIENDIEASGYEPLIYGDERWSLVLAKLASTL